VPEVLHGVVGGHEQRHVLERILLYLYYIGICTYVM
jgi:hypothetical protein